MMPTMKNKQTVWIMVGIIGSGKTSWAKMKAGMNHMTSIVSKDDIRAMLHGKYIFDELMEEMVSCIAMDSIRRVLYSGHNLIVDECHITNKERKDLIDLIKENYPQVKVMLVYCPSKIGNVERRMLSPKNQPEYVRQQVYNRMIKKFEEPPASGDGRDGLIIVNKELGEDAKSIY